ncbi:MAG: CAP domain-containing protein [Bacteroidota bacterium]
MPPHLHPDADNFLPTLPFPFHNPIKHPALRHALLLPCCLFLLLATSCEQDISVGEDITVPSDQTSSEATTTPTSNAAALEALDLVNAIRADGCTCGDDVMPPAPPVELHAALQAAAAGHSTDQALSNHMSHVGSDGSRVGDRLSAAGYRWRSVGENVAWNQRSVTQVVNAWKNSPGHCRNLMNPDYIYMGLAVEEWYWTQVLAR